MAEANQDSVMRLADQLSNGFTALTGEYALLFEQQRQLESKLTWAKQQYLDLLKRLAPATLSQDHLAFLTNLEHAGSESTDSHTEWIEQLSQSEDPERRSRATAIKLAEHAAARLQNDGDRGVKIWNGPSADKVKPALRIQLDRSSTERDFTTAGVPSKLGCPFSAAAGSRPRSSLATPRSSISRGSHPGRRSQRPSFHDPIRAEICGNNDPESATGSIEGSAAVCPIRFLDQHKPEEVAKYFENHKHDLPRSHEICIKRFQSNAESIEQLDRKYGDLVSMIQGLGEKHQGYLPPEPEEGDEAADSDTKTDSKVQKWAKEVPTSLQELTPDEAEAPDGITDEARTAHFDRPFREIRVGESPSRPWGVQIPTKYTNAESSSSVAGSAPTASPPLPAQAVGLMGVTPEKPGKCPFDHKAFAKSPAPAATEPAVTEQPTTPPSKTEPRTAPKPAEMQENSKEAPRPVSQAVPQMVFNGPVFIGYPPDQLMALLQKSNLGGAVG